MTDAAQRINVDFRAAPAPPSPALTRQSLEVPPDEQPLPPWPPYAAPAVAEASAADPAVADPAGAEPAVTATPEQEPADVATLGKRLRAAQRGKPPAADGTDGNPEDAPRTIVIYEKKSRGLLIFTAMMVALTIGVVLGQTSMAELGGGSATARTEPVGAGYSTPPETAPPPGPSAPGPGTRITAPLAGAKTHRFEVGGGADLVSIRSTDLGDALYDITTFDGSAVPQMAGGARLELIRTGTPGRVGADIQLNSRVRWTLRLDGGSGEQTIDLSGGRLAGLELTGAATRVVLRLPKPTGTIPITVAGPASEFDVQAGAPVRVRLGKGADDTAIGARSRHAVPAGAVLASAGWTRTTNRYDIKAAAKLTLVRISAGPHALPSGPPSSGRSAPPTPSASTASTAAHPGVARG
jgi:hypothetical protein